MTKAKEYTQWECQECLKLHTTEIDANNCCEEKQCGHASWEDCDCPSWASNDMVCDDEKFAETKQGEKGE